MSYITIGTEIYNLLNTITQINILYQHEPKELKEYPAVTISALGHKNIPHDTAGNVRQFQFMIRAYYRTDIAGDAESILRDLADKIITKLEGSVSLNGSCDYTRATEAKYFFGEKEVPMRWVEIMIEAVKRVNR